MRVGEALGGLLYKHISISGTALQVKALNHHDVLILITKMNFLEAQSIH